MSPHALAERDAQELESRRPFVGRPDAQTASAVFAPLHANDAREQQHQPHKRHKRQRAGRSKKWKPYSKLTWEEKLALEAKEKKAAQELEARGRGVRPPPRTDRGRLKDGVALQEYVPPTPRNTTDVGIHTTLQARDGAAPSHNALVRALT